MQTLDKELELQKLNDFCIGKVVVSIKYRHDDLLLLFSDGTAATLSTLGGIEIAELKE